MEQRRQNYIGGFGEGVKFGGEIKGSSRSGIFPWCSRKPVLREGEIYHKQKKGGIKRDYCKHLVEEGSGRHPLQKEISAPYQKRGE